MNNACPTCGAVYAVTTKDIGRRLKCKKCSTSLAVTDEGLVVDTPTGSAVPVDDEDTGGGVITKSKKLKKLSAGGGPGLGEMLTKIGGIPTILFAFGTFLVLWFTFMGPIGQAATARAHAALDKLKLERESKIKKLLKGKKEHELNEEEQKKYREDSKKINEEYEKLLDEADQDAKSAQISNIRSVWFDRYGQLFGFVFLAFGCIGYLRTEQPLVMRIVAAVVLALMLLMVFSQATGCGGSRPSAIKGIE